MTATAPELEALLARRGLGSGNLTLSKLMPGSIVRIATSTGKALLLQIEYKGDLETIRTVMFGTDMRFEWDASCNFYTDNLVVGEGFQFWQMGSGHMNDYSGNITEITMFGPESRV